MTLTLALIAHLLDGSLAAVSFERLSLVFCRPLFTRFAGTSTSSSRLVTASVCTPCSLTKRTKSVHGFLCQKEQLVSCSRGYHGLAVAKARKAPLEKSKWFLISSKRFCLGYASPCGFDSPLRATAGRRSPFARFRIGMVMVELKYQDLSRQNDLRRKAGHVGRDLEVTRS